MTLATVAELFIYPVKSMRAIARERANLTKTGLEWDRQWMLVDASGTFLSQRTHPQLARFQPEITAESLVIRTPGRSPLEVPLSCDGRRGGERIAVRVHRDRCIGVDQGREAAHWASEALAEAVKLVRVPPDPARVADPIFAGTVPAPMGFADGYPLLVCNQASLEDLNSRLSDAIPMERFRPNLVLAGLAAWAEDHIEALAIEGVMLRLVKPCTRCTIPSVDQRTGMRATDPAPVLRQFRFDRTLRGVTFGENAVVVTHSGCEIRRGSQCRVTFTV